MRSSITSRNSPRGSGSVPSADRARVSLRRVSRATKNSSKNFGTYHTSSHTNALCTSLWKTLCSPPANPGLPPTTSTHPHPGLSCPTTINTSHTPTGLGRDSDDQVLRAFIHIINRPYCCCFYNFQVFSLNNSCGEKYSHRRLGPPIRQTSESVRIAFQTTPYALR
mgnify:FL=1